MANPRPTEIVEIQMTTTTTPTPTEHGEVKEDGVILGCPLEMEEESRGNKCRRS